MSSGTRGTAWYRLGALGHLVAWGSPPLHPTLGGSKAWACHTKVPKCSTWHGEPDAPSPASIRPVLVELQQCSYPSAVSENTVKSNWGHNSVVRWPNGAGKKVAGSWRPQGAGRLLTFGRHPLVRSAGSRGRLCPAGWAQSIELPAVSNKLIGGGHLIVAPSTPGPSHPESDPNSTG